MRYQTIGLTFLTLLAFAANSILCRMALKADLIDPVSFTQIRLFSGALFLAPFFYLRRAKLLPLKLVDARAALVLFVYAIAFSLAYISLDAGAGALILFGMVQVTMIGAAIFKGDRPGAIQWLGILGSLAGLFYLNLPGLSAPPLGGALLMAAAGMAWGAYSLLGKSEADSVGATARNFVLTLPLLALLFLAQPGVQISTHGVALAVASGALASGAGYVIWYRALKELSTANASVVQLAVPIIAALGGVVLLSEPLTMRLFVASTLILGGIYLSIRYNTRN